MDSGAEPLATLRKNSVRVAPHYLSLPLLLSDLPLGMPTPRAVLPEAAKHPQHPLEWRTLALSALASGEERPFLRILLEEFEENAVTQKMLEETNSKPPKVVADFN